MSGQPTSTAFTVGKCVSRERGDTTVPEPFGLHFVECRLTVVTPSTRFEPETASSLRECQSLSLYADCDERRAALEETSTEKGAAFPGKIIGH